MYAEHNSAKSLNLNNTLGPHNSVTSLNSLKLRLPHPPSSARSTSATPRTVRNQTKLREKTLASIKLAYQTIEKMTNEQFNKVVTNLKTFKKYSHLGKISINNIPYLIVVF